MVRLADIRDFPDILRIYSAARDFMKRSGNPAQWGDSYPPESLLREDLSARRLYAVERNGRICGAFVLLFGPEPTYASMEDGSWENDLPYATIHRVAGDGTAKGVFEECAAFCRGQSDHLRIDTHRDNRVMRHLIEKNGFARRGIIRVRDGSPRIAYQYDRK